MFPLHIEQFVPHSGDMSLLDKILDAGEEWLIAEVRISRDSLFAQASGIPGWVGLEYLAQGIAAYSGYQESLRQQKPKIGFLVGTRRYEVSAAFFRFDDVLRIEVRQELKAENGLHVFACQLSSGQGVTASANINVFQPENVKSYLEGE